MSTPAFMLATHDPTTAETGVIAGRSVFARRFTLSEVQSIAAEIQKAVKVALEKGSGFTVRDEIKPVAKALNARIADGGKPFTVDELLDALTEAEYRELLRHYAPSLLGAVGGEGKA
jgi:hypothetical protein